MIPEHHYPVLYSFRRCPYAIRARLALWVSGVYVVLREVELRHKPVDLLNISPKATVPVLQLENNQIIEESLDIMYWALQRNDPERWLDSAYHTEAYRFIQRNDSEFKYCLDRFKYPDRYPEHPAIEYRQQGEIFLAELEQRLTYQRFLCGDHFTLADAAILPFIRQFAAVDGDWFQQSTYCNLRLWLNEFLNSERFLNVMKNYQPWRPEDPTVFFGNQSILFPS